MQSESGAILVVTDFTTTSDRAVVAGGALAHSNGAELYVLHALDLRSKPLREALTCLDPNSAQVTASREAVREQMRRLLPIELCRNSPIIELESRDAAIARCVQYIAPRFVIFPDADEVLVHEMKS